MRCRLCYLRLLHHCTTEWKHLRVHRSFLLHRWPVRRKLDDYYQSRTDGICVQLSRVRELLDIIWLSHLYDAKRASRGSRELGVTGLHHLYVHCVVPDLIDLLLKTFRRTKDNTDFPSGLPSASALPSLSAGTPAQTSAATSQPSHKSHTAVIAAVCSY